MDITTDPELTAPDATDVSALIDSLAHVDSADAPETAATIARLLTDELDDVRGEASAEQLQAFDGTTEPED